MVINLGAQKSNIGGIYSNPLRVAAGLYQQKMSNEQRESESKRNQMRTAISAAGMALRQKMVNDANLERTQLANDAATERQLQLQDLKLKQTLELDKAQTLKKLRDPVAESEKINKLYENSPSYTSFKSSLLGNIRNNLSVSGDDPTVRQQAKNILNLNDEELDSWKSGLISDDVINEASSPFFKTIQDDYKNRELKETLGLDKEKASRTKLLNEVEEGKISLRTAKDLSNLRDKNEGEIADLIEDNTYDEDEKRTILKSIKDIDVILATADDETVKKYNQARLDFKRSSTAVDNTIEQAVNIEDLFNRVETAGGKIDLDTSTELRSVVARIGGENEPTIQELNKLFEDNIKISGNLNSSQKKQIKAEFISNLNQIVGNFTMINRAIKGNVGVQTENDFSRGYRTVISLGNSRETFLNNLRVGVDYLVSSKARSAADLKLPGVLEDSLDLMRERDIKLTSLGMKYVEDDIEPQITQDMPNNFGVLNTTEVPVAEVINIEDEINNINSRSGLDITEEDLPLNIFED
jgi:hypothetical protein